MSKESNIKTGGLMRCCIKTIVDKKSSDKEGDTINCTYCGESMIFVNGFWKWFPEGEREHKK